MLAPGLQTFLTNQQDQTVVRTELLPHLPQILQGGYECRLTAGSSRIDIHQCARNVTEDQLLLMRFLERMDHAGSHWRTLRRFCNQWMTPSNSIHTGVWEIWMEYDALFGATRPNLFFGLSRELDLPLSVEITEQICSLFLKEHGKNNIIDHIRHYAEVLFGKEVISYLGLMLGRPAKTVRINVRGVCPERFEEYLKLVEWPGPMERVRWLKNEFFSDIERIILCLDVGTVIGPTIGFECEFSEQPPRENGWERFLNKLVIHKLCSRPRADGILSWPGLVTPNNTKSPWPDYLILASILGEKKGCSVIEKRISHLKISLDFKGAISAKGYLWYNSDWRFQDS